MSCMRCGGLLLAGLLVGLLTATGCAETPADRRHAAVDYPPSAPKQIKTLGLPWESTFGYVQSVQSGPLIHIAGQFSVDASGAVVGVGSMETQLRQAYANVQKVLDQYAATMEDVLEETLFVTDMETAFTAASKVRRDVYGGSPAVASTMVQVQRLALRDAMVAIQVTAKTHGTLAPRSSEGDSSGSRHRGGGMGGRRGGGMGGGMGGMGGGYPY